MKMHSLFLLALFGLMLVSCRTQTGGRSGKYVGSKPVISTPLLEGEAYVKWVTQLHSQADLVLKLYDATSIERLKPLPQDGRRIFGVLPQIIPGTNVCGRSLAVVVLPQIYPISDHHQNPIDDGLDFRDYLKAQGFRRVIVVQQWNSMEIQLFPQGWPSRAEVEMEKTRNAAGTGSR